MTQLIVLLTIVAIVGLTNGFVLQNQRLEYFHITGLNGGALTAFPEGPHDGHAYPAAGNVTVENLSEIKASQRWSIVDGFGGQVYINSEINSWNLIRVYFIHPSSFPVENTWTIEQAGGGTVLIYTTFILDDKISCLINNGISHDISFGPCDRTPFSSSHWKIVPVQAAN